MTPDRDAIARIIAGPLCDATKSQHSVMRTGGYSFCTKCGETISRKHQIGMLEAENKADAIMALLNRPVGGTREGDET